MSGSGPDHEAPREVIAHEPDHRTPGQQRHDGHRHDQADVGPEAEQRIDRHGDRLAGRHRQDAGEDHFHPGENEAEEGGDADPRRDGWNEVPDERSAAASSRRGRPSRPTRAARREMKLSRIQIAIGMLNRQCTSAMPTGEFTRPSWAKRMKIGRDSTTGGVTRKISSRKKTCRSPVKR